MRLTRSFVLSGGRLSFHRSMDDYLLPEPPELPEPLQLEPSDPPFAGTLPDLFDASMFDAVIQPTRKKRSLSDFFSASKPSKRTCTCSRSRCVKGYCDCFSDGRACGPDCGCVGCLNTEPPKKPSLTRIACRCGQSRCLKQYCVCHRAGRKCAPACRCTDCGNF